MSEPCRPQRGEGYEACDDSRGYREKRFSIRQDKNTPKNKKTAA